MHSDLMGTIANRIMLGKPEISKFANGTYTHCTALKQSITAAVADAAEAGSLDPKSLKLAELYTRAVDYPKVSSSVTRSVCDEANSFAFQTGRPVHYSEVRQYTVSFLVFRAHIRSSSFLALIAEGSQTL